MTRIDAAALVPTDQCIELRIGSESNADQVLEFDAPKTVLVGSTADADLVLANDDGASKYHCRIELNPPDCYV